MFLTFRILTLKPTARSQLLSAAYLADLPFFQELFPAIRSYSSPPRHSPACCGVTAAIRAMAAVFHAIYRTIISKRRMLTVILANGTPGFLLPTLFIRSQIELTLNYLNQSIARRHCSGIHPASAETHPHSAHAGSLCVVSINSVGL